MHQYDIERYLNVRNAGGADLGPDGRLSFLLNTTGTGQVWSLDEPLGWPEQHTFFEESVSFVDSSPERRGRLRHGRGRQRARPAIPAQL